MMLLTWVTLGSAKDWLWRILKADKVETAIRYERIIAKEAKMKARSKISIGGQSPRSLASFLLMVFILLTLNGCSGYRTHITLADEKLAVTGRPSAVPVEFLDEFPSENYEVLGKVYADALGVLHVSPDTSTVDELITKKAGSIGADAVVHMHYGIAPYFVGTKWLSWGSGLAISM